MLRITCTVSSEANAATVKVEGRMTDRWVDELASVAASALRKQPKVRLDLADVTFVDGRGQELLQSLRQRGVELVACSAFVRELLGGGDDGSLE